MTRFCRILLVLGLIVITATVQGPLNVAAAGKAVEAERVEAALRPFMAEEKVATVEAERILAALRTVMADETAAAVKKGEAERLLTALLTEATDEKAEAARAQALKSFYQVAATRTVQRDPLIKPMGSGCDTVFHEQYGTNVLGNDLWGYFQQIDYCWNDGVLTRVERERWGNTYWILWYFDGHTENSTYGGEGQSRFRGVTQGHFSLCLAYQGIGCIQHAYPRSDRTAYARS